MFYSKPIGISKGDEHTPVFRGWWLPGASEEKMSSFPRKHFELRASTSWEGSSPPIYCLGLIIALSIQLKPAVCMKAAPQNPSSLSQLCTGGHCTLLLQTRTQPAALCMHTALLPSQIPHILNYSSIQLLVCVSLQQQASGKERDACY